MKNFIKDEIERYSVIENSKRFVLVKISDLLALENMKKGKWRFRHPSYFQYEELCKGDYERGDGLDCVLKCQDIFKEHTHGITVGSYRCNDENIIDSCRIICFYKLDIDNNNNFTPLDKKLLELGENFVFVEHNKFTKSISQNYNTKHDNIAYYSENKYSGIVGMFSKRDNYIHQNEYRVIIESENFLDEINQNSKIRETREELSKYYKMDCDKSKTSNVNHRVVHNEIKKLEKELCELKKDYYIDEPLADNIASEIFSISELIDKY